jgi:23S rRNA-/tRNA-specific pseudouridylate synthase
MTGERARDDTTSVDVSSRILLREAGVVVVDKPAGLSTVGRTLEDPNCLQWMLGNTLGHRVWAVHQLDVETSGVNVFVERANLVQRWQERIRFPNAKKRYLALVHGALQKEDVVVDAPIADDNIARRQVVRDDGRRALTLFRTLAKSETDSALVVEIRTGRTHQVRVHASHIGHPLHGEKRYRDPPSVTIARHALHALSLTLDDGMRLIAPVPDDVRALLVSLGFDADDVIARALAQGAPANSRA